MAALLFSGLCKCLAQQSCITLTLLPNKELVIGKLGFPLRLNIVHRYPSVLDGLVAHLSLGSIELCECVILKNDTDFKITLSAIKSYIRLIPKIQPTIKTLER